MVDTNLEIKKQLEEVLKQARELEKKLMVDTQLNKLDSLFDGFHALGISF